MLRIALIAVLAVIVTACGSSSSEERGSGGSAATGGTASTDGGGAGGADTCPPIQSYCPQGNWCGGGPVLDSNGCQRFACANGADPCVTEPCAKSEDCEADKVCGGDHLCWPANSFCEPPHCASISGSGHCTWSCVDGIDYQVSCSLELWGDCSCFTGNSDTSYSCWEGGGSLETGACCGLPPFNPPPDDSLSTHGKPIWDYCK
jgi:hypothetical protein